MITDRKLHIGLEATDSFSSRVMEHWFPNKMQIFTFIWKEDSGPLSNSPGLFLLCSDKMPLKFLLVQKWLHTRNVTFVAFCCVCGGSSFRSLLVKFPQVLELDLLDNLLKAAVIHLCLWTFFYHNFPFQSTFHQYAFILHHEQLALSTITICSLLSTWKRVSSGQQQSQQFLPWL